MHTIMVCRLCLKYFKDLFNMFDTNGQKVCVAEVAGKHLWFKPQTDDPISTAICKHCRIKLLDFNEFYLMVEKAQSQIHDGFMVKTEITEISDESLLPKACEPYDVFDELGEVPINMSLDDATNELEETTRGVKETPRDVLLNNDFSADDETAIEDKETPCDVLLNNDFSADDNDKDDKDYSHHKDESDDTHDSQDVYINTRNKGNLNRTKSRVLTKKTTKNSKRSKLDNKSDDDENGDSTKMLNTEKKKRGRPRTEEGKSRRPIESQEKHEAYKLKMNEYDKQIADFMKLYCAVCCKESENFPALRVHMRDEHNIKDGYVTCCDKKFNKRAVLVYHIRHHLNPNCYRCEDCDFTFADRQSMHNHFLVKHQKDEDKLYECTKCPKKFSRKYLLEQHNSFSHRGRISKCKTCKKRFKTPEELVEHNKEDCSAGTMCDICAKVIQGAPAFKRHQLEHQGVEMPKAQCNLCGFWCKHKSSLKKHLRRHTESKTPHTCDICQKVSPSRSAMLSHKRYAHDKGRMYACSVCQKAFKKPLSLREHMTVHTGEVLYNCPHCPKTFNSNANMHSHRKKAHPKEFEETRKLKKRNTFVIQQPVATGLNNVKQEEALVRSTSNNDFNM